MNTTSNVTTTPGPWVVRPTSTTPFFSISHGKQIIAVFKKTDPQAFANAAMIAALPELVNALVQVQGKLEELSGEIDATQADPVHVLALATEMSEIVSEAFEKIAAESDGLIGD
jgi:hypothetical protein